MLGRFGERTMNRCTPGVRHNIGFQSTVDRGRMRDDKHDSLLRSGQGQRGEVSGAVSGAVVMAYAIRDSKVGLGLRGPEGASGWLRRAVERVRGRQGRCLAGEGRAAASFIRVYASFV
jgi:hypothetical protein